MNHLAKTSSANGLLIACAILTLGGIAATTGCTREHYRRQADDEVYALLGRIEALGYKGYFSIEMFNEELWHLPADQAAQRMYTSLLPFCQGA